MRKRWDEMSETGIKRTTTAAAAAATAEVNVCLCERKNENTIDTEMWLVSMCVKESVKQRNNYCYSPRDFEAKRNDDRQQQQNRMFFRFLLNVVLSLSLAHTKPRWIWNRILVLSVALAARQNQFNSMRRVCLCERANGLYRCVRM